MASRTTSSLWVRSPRVDEREAEAVVLERYGMRATATRLPGEKDDNFLVRSGTGAWLFKVFHADERPEAIDLATQALLFVEDADPELPVERIVPSAAGELEVRFAPNEGPERTGRLTTFLPGRSLSEVEPDPALRSRLGSTLARLGAALEGFDHPAAARDLVWDLRNSDRLVELLDEIPADADGELLRAVLERFAQSVRPRLEPLRAQVVHNDFTSSNVLVDAAGVSGIIDFGDLLRTQLVNDLAIAATQHIGLGRDPLGPALEVIAGYRGTTPLAAAETSLLLDLIRTRIAAVVTVTTWRASRFPENRDYILRGTARARARLRALARLPASALCERLGPQGRSQATAS